MSSPWALAGKWPSTASAAYTGTVPTCRGSLRALLLYDVAEEFDFEELRSLLGAEPPARSPGFKLPAPGYVRFERPPVLEVCEPIHFATGESANARLRYFDYGVVSLEIEMQFETDWPGLIALSNRWIEAGEVEQRGLKSVRDRLARLRIRAAQALCGVARRSLLRRPSARGPRGNRRPVDRISVDCPIRPRDQPGDPRRDPASFGRRAEGSPRRQPLLLSGRPPGGRLARGLSL